MVYREAHRPQFHFTARNGWLNDPNGLVYYDGEYHLFFQHNPFGTDWGNMTWGHAVSPDLVHWTQLPNALEPDSMGTIYSGSAVIDWEDTAGFGAESLIALYTAEGDQVEPKAPTTQCLAYSTDRGRTMTKFAGNPIMPEITRGNRDPRVFWHKPSQRWIMALYVKVDGTETIQFFASEDLKSWRFLSRVDGFHECPECFPLGDQWILFGGAGHYVIGEFDGERFAVASGLHVGDWGPNFYAAQTYSDIPAEDGRRILIGWMRGGRYPNMPFNQQMTFPCELTLENGRLHKWPVREIESLYSATHDDLDTKAELLDIEAGIEVGGAWACGFDLRGLHVRYLPGDQQLLVGTHRAPLPLVDGRIRLRLLLDRSSVEVFGNDGSVALSTCFLPRASQPNVRYFSHGNRGTLKELRVRELRSAWET